jgi:hypothetical protein
MPAASIRASICSRVMPRSVSCFTRILPPKNASRAGRSATDSGVHMFTTASIAATSWLLMI